MLGVSWACRHRSDRTANWRQFVPRPEAMRRHRGTPCIEWRRFGGFASACSSNWRIASERLRACPIDVKLSRATPVSSHRYTHETPSRRDPCGCVHQPEQRQKHAPLGQTTALNATAPFWAKTCLSDRLPSVESTIFYASLLHLFVFCCVFHSVRPFMSP